MKLIYSYLSGLIFGIGISISGMANPAKVLTFFDVAGTWDPSLAFVMGGALVVTFIGYRFVLKRPAPLMSASFQLPTRRDLDLSLIGVPLFSALAGELQDFVRAARCLLWAPVKQTSTSL